MTRHHPLFCLALFICLPAAAAPPQSTSHQRTGRPAGGVAQPALGEVPLAEDAPGEENFKYTHFNEVEGYLFEPRLEPDGAVISVGTFRGLNLASSGKVAQLIQMDYNLGVKLFNLMNNQLIVMSKDRFEYLSLLLTGERQTQLIAEARSGKLDTKAYMAALKAKFQKDHPNAKGILTEKWKSLGVKLSPANWDKIKEMNNQEGFSLEHFMHGKMFNYLARTTPQEISTYTIFGNDKRFGTIQKMLSEGRVTVMNGDLTGDKAISSIGTALKENHIPLAAVDISNVPDYFGTPDADYDPAKAGNDVPPGLAAFKALKKNLESLPLTDKSKILMTAIDTDNTSKGLGWTYFAFDKKHLSQWADCYERIYSAPKEKRKSLDVEMKSFLVPDRGGEKGKGVVYVPAGGGG